MLSMMKTIPAEKHLIPILHSRAQSRLTHIEFMDKHGRYRTYPYQNLWFDLVLTSGLLEKAGTKAGDVVALILPTQEEFLMGFFGCQHLQALPFSFAAPTALTDLNDWYSGIKITLSELNCTTLITDNKVAQILAKLDPNNGLKIINLSCAASELSKNKSASDISAVIAREFDSAKYLETEIAFLQLSSGTTGQPKAVMITQKNVLTNTRIIADSLPVENKDIALVSWLPLYHDMGLVGCLLMSIVNGTRVLLFNPHDFLVNPLSWLKAMDYFRCTITTAPNFAYGLVKKRVAAKDLASLDLSCLKGTLCGAENVSAATAKSFIDHMKPAKFPAESFLPVYGLAEASLAVSFTEPSAELKTLKLNSEHLEKGIVALDENGIEICSVGRILPTFELKITDTKGQAVPDGRVGQIQIKGPCVTSGYFRNQKLNHELIENGWLKTGDEGFLLDDQLYICGRLKDIIIVNGANHYPVLYEEKLSTLANIRKGKTLVSSIKLPEFDSDQIVVLAECLTKTVDVQRKLELEADITRIIKKSGLPLYKVEVLPPGTLKKTSSGKIQRRLNIQLWKEGRLTPPLPRNLVSNFKDILKRLTKRKRNDQRTNF